MHYFSLYIEFIKIKMKAMFEYRGVFISGFVAQFVSYGATYMLLWIMVNTFGTLNNWNPYEVLFLLSLNLCSYAIAAFFFYGLLYNLSVMVQTGEFDEVLTKPLNPFLYTIGKNFTPGYVTHITLSVIIMVLCFINLKIQASFVNISFLILVLIGGALIQAAGLLALSVLSFWLIQSNSVAEVIFFELIEFIKYPLSLYSTGIQIIFSLVIPFGFISFYPAQYFLRKNDFLMFHPVFQYLTPIVGVIVFFLAYRFWKFGVDNYKSTGS